MFGLLCQLASCLSLYDPLELTFSLFHIICCFIHSFVVSHVSCIRYDAWLSLEESLYFVTIVYSESIPNTHIVSFQALISNKRTFLSSTHYQLLFPFANTRISFSFTYARVYVYKKTDRNTLKIAV